jgi:hypothetical protein
MEASNMPLSTEHQQKKLNDFIFIAVIAVVPIILSFIMKSNLSSEEYSKAVASLKGGFQNGSFWFDGSSTDAALYLTHVWGIKALLQFYNLICLAVGAVLFSITVDYKKESLIPVTTVYVVLSLLSLNSFVSDCFLGYSRYTGLYNRLSLVSFDIRVMHGAVPVLIYFFIAAGYIFFLVSELIRKPEGF